MEQDIFNKETEDPTLSNEDTENTESKTKININNLNGSFLKDTGDVTIYEASNLKDLTIEWGKTSHKSKYTLEEKDISKYADDLWNNRVLLLHCLDEGIIDELIEKILDKTISKNKIESPEKRHLFFRSNDQDTDELSSYEAEKLKNTSIEQFSKERKQKGKTCFLKVDLVNSGFFTSLQVNNKTHSKSLTDELKTKNIFIICKINDESFVKIIESKLPSVSYIENSSLDKKIYFPFYKIPFLQIILQYQFKEKWKVIRDILISQKEQGFWGKDKTDSELYNTIIPFLEKGSDKLEQEIKDRRNGIFIKKLKGKIETLPLNKKLHKHILFITAFFPRISTTEFKLLVNLLLNEKTEEIKTPVNQDVEENGNKIIYTTEVIHLQDEWEKKGDEILENCKIFSTKLENGRVYFDFEEPELNDEVCIIIQETHSLFFEKQFQTIINSGIFFETKLSKQFVQNLLENLINMVPYDPNLYGLNLLHWIFVRIFTKNTGIKLKKKIEELNEEELELVKKHIEQQQFERSIGFNRLLELMRLMLDKSDLLNQQVLDFINILFYKNLYLIILRMVEYLQNSSQINEIHWIKRILNQKEAKGKIHYECIRRLYQITKLNTYETFDILNKFKEWWPNNSSNNKLSLSQSNSILLILFFGDPLYGKFPLDYYGKWPSKFFLFNSISNNRNQKEHWQFLIQWLFHPKMVEAYKTIDNGDVKTNKSIEDILIRRQAFIIESWYLIMNGTIHSKKIPAIQKESINLMFTRIGEILTKSQLTQFKKCICSFSNEYRQELHNLKNRKIKNELRIELFESKRAACKTLYNEIKNI